MTLFWYNGTNIPQGGIMKDEKLVQTTFRLKESEHQNLKILAAKEKKTIQELILSALDKIYLNWRKEN